MKAFLATNVYHPTMEANLQLKAESGDILFTVLYIKPLTNKY